MPNFQLRRGLFCSFVTGLALLVPSVGSAQQAPQRVANGNGEGMDTHLFRPAVDSKGFFSVNGTDVLGAKDFSLGLVSDYGYNLMRLQPGHTAGALLTHSFQGVFSFNYGVADDLVLGINIPINLMGQELATAVGPAAAPYDVAKGEPQSFAYIGLHAKWRLMRVERILGLAAIAQFGFAGGGATQDLGADTVFFWPQLAIEKRVGSTGQLKFGLNGGYRLHTQKNPRFDQLSGGPAFEYGNQLTAGFGIAYRVLPAVDLIGETYLTKIAGGNSASAVSLSDEAVGGIKVFIENNSFLMLGGGSRLTKGFEAADARAFIGFIFEPSVGDRDGDGYKDDVDKCPDQPEDFDGFQDEDGCPDPDNDNDGVLDVDDRCPNVPGPRSNQGCPESRGGDDRDGDGIPDELDKCPDQPEDKDGFQDEDGCPDPDNDKDGIPDKVDQCPNDPEDRDGFEDEDGCPDPDNDKDGIPDVRDKCPNQPETYNGYQDEDGCPDKGNVILQGNDLIILQKVMFKTGSAEILPESNAILDAVATTVIHHPEFTLIEVQGHADERSDDDYNLRLTKARAEAVVEALSHRGVQRNHMRHMGYGEYCPIDPTHNPVAWEKNRRVEFKVLKTQDGPTGAEVGCSLARSKGVNPPPVQ